MADFFQQLFLIIIGGQQCFNLFSEFIRLLVGCIAIAQFLIDYAKLLTQIIISLIFIHCFFYAVLNICFQSKDLIFAFQKLCNDFQPTTCTVLLQ